MERPGSSSESGDHKAAVAPVPEGGGGLYWGELPPLVVQDADSGLAALEREQICQPRGLVVEPAPLPASVPLPATNEAGDEANFNS